jgi:uncharacterized protein YdaU (DUF1376 family)
MAKDPAILFYTSDFISGTITMTDEQRGQYILLLCLQHQKGFLTEKDMLKICNSYDEDIWCKFVNDNGKYYNQRLKDEAEKRQKYSESRRDNRKKKETKPKNTKNTSKTYVKHMENENENINKDVVILNNEWCKQFFHTKFLNDTSMDVFNKLVRIDGYTIDDIKNAIQWARGDDFWSKNFLSPVKLRNKNKEGVKYIDVFLAKLLDNGRKPNGKGPATTDEQLAAIIRKHFPE